MPFQKIISTAMMIITAVAISSMSYASEGVITIKSHHSVAVTADKLEAALKSKGMTVFARIDHAAGANSVGMQLPPTELLIFGNPRIGTPLMKCAPKVALDLPQKALIHKDEKGVVWLTYNNPDYLQSRHKIMGCDKVLKKVANALNNFAKAATNK